MLAVISPLSPATPASLTVADYGIPIGRANSGDDPQHGGSIGQLPLDAATVVRSSGPYSHAGTHADVVSAP